MPKIKYTPKTYEQWDALLGSRLVKKVENNTEISRVIGKDGKDDFCLKLHGNTIAVWSADGLITLYDGGYRSATTKSRLNQFASAGVFQFGFQWLIGRVDAAPFENGVKILVSPITGVASIVSQP